MGWPGGEQIGLADGTASEARLPEGLGPAQADPNRSSHRHADRERRPLVLRAFISQSPGRPPPSGIAVDDNARFNHAMLRHRAVAKAFEF